jgi:precorrin-3B synthase
MESGDGLLIRVKPFGGRLSAGTLVAIAEVASGCGNGIVELTSRGNVQLRGLTPDSAAVAAEALVAAGLADADPARERRRNVIAVPPCDDALVARIEGVLAGIDGLAAKFCVAVGEATADIVVRDGMVAAGGVWVPCAAADVPEVVEAIARRAGGRRIVVMTDACSAGTPPPAPPAREGEQYSSPLPLREGLGEGAVRASLVALPFGQTDADALRGLAALVGDSDVRTTPWRAFWIDSPPDPATLAALGFLTDASDPRHSIAACPGAPACASASVPTRADAAFLAARGMRNIHVSGCAKGCAHHNASTTLVGSNGRYDLVRHGRAGETPDARGLTLGEVSEMLA